MLYGRKLGSKLSVCLVRRFVYSKTNRKQVLETNERFYLVRPDRETFRKFYKQYFVTKNHIQVDNFPKTMLVHLCIFHDCLNVLFLLPNYGHFHLDMTSGTIPLTKVFSIWMGEPENLVNLSCFSGAK